MVTKGQAQRLVEDLEQKLMHQEEFYSGQIAAQASKMRGLEDTQKELLLKLVRPCRLLSL